jgi:phosphoribosylformimino-5-aminoimidazole carboxamide ribotide isomerase
MTTYGDVEGWLERLRHQAPTAAPTLHLIDLAGARQGRFSAWDALRLAVDRGFAVEVGGGMREADTVCRALDLGARYVILGTSLLEWIRDRAPSRPPWPSDQLDRLAAALDIRNGQAVVRGWTNPLGPADTWFDRLVELGFSRLLITDVDRDGTLLGLNEPAAAGFWQGWAERGRRAGVTVVAGGGIGDASDLARLKAWGVPAAVIGRAWIEGRVPPYGP